MNTKLNLDDMDIDLEKLNSKLEKMENKGKGGNENSNWFTPKEGTQTIRFLPDPGKDPFKEVWLHYGVPNHRKGIVCLKRQFGKDCPICSLATALWKKKLDPEVKDEKGKPKQSTEQMIAKKLFAKERYYSAIIERKEGEALPKGKWFAYGGKNYKTLVELSKNPDYRNITHYKTGRDFTVKMIPSGKEGNKTNYNEITLTVGGKEKPLTDSKENAIKILESVKDLMELMKEQVKTKEEINQILQEQFNFDEEGHVSLGGESDSQQEEKEDQSAEDVFKSLED